MFDSTHLPEGLAARLKEFSEGHGQLVALTGAGISAESGIPTFRGKEGYWTVGSREYHPQEMATYGMFRQRPADVWAWYLYRRGICRSAEPNPGHKALVALERSLGDRFLLITQNVDGLHLRAGNSLDRTYQIHGNIDYVRCCHDCGIGVIPMPRGVRNKKRGEALTAEDVKHLRCECGEWLRPHVLWFDECYDEENFRFSSSLEAAQKASLLVVVGTSGATNLPMQVGLTALSSGATIVDINPESNPFSEMAEQARNGYFLQGASGQFLPALARRLEG